MEQLADSQLEVGEKIEELIRSIKEDRPAKQNQTYYEDKLRKLDQLWNTFETGDRKLRKEYPAAVHHAYYRNSYDNQVRGLYERKKAEIQRRLAALRGEQVFSPSEGVEQLGNTMALTEDNGDLERNEEMGKLAIQESSYVEILPSTSSIIATIIRKSKGTSRALGRLMNRVADTERPLDKGFCEAHLQHINKLWDEIREQLQHLYEFTDNPEEVGYDMELHVDLEGKMYDVTSELTGVIMKSDSTTSPSYGNRSSSTMIKLPKVTLPKFEGNYLTWTQFHDLYTQMVHHQSISPCQKMWYLKTHLSGEAERLIRHLPLSDENYLSAWKLLTDRYNNKRLLVSALLHQLLGQPSLNTESPNGIKGLHDTTRECILGLHNIGIDTASWSPMLLHLLIKKLDRATHSLYEQSLTHPKDLQTIEDFLMFLETRFQSLEALGNKGRCGDENDRFRSQRRSAYNITTNEARCILCKQDHQLVACRKFLESTHNERYRILKEKNICFNCLKPGHQATTCTTGNCRKCSKTHHTLLHVEFTQPQSPRSNQGRDRDTRTTAPSTSMPASLTVQAKDSSPAYILLSTVVINVTDAKGEDVQCRAILDSGSQVNLATESLANRLGLRPNAAALSILGIGRGKEVSRHRMNCQIKSRTSAFSTRIEVFILPTVTVDQPACFLDTSRWNIPKNIRLGDPRFHRPGKIDLLLGAELYLQLLSIGQIRLGEELPTLQNTVFGWIVSGRASPSMEVSPQCGVCTCENNELETQVKRFWKLEDVEPVAESLTKAEAECESFFNKTTRRDKHGRFIVNLPFNQEPSNLGNSKEIAFRRFHALERKLTKDPELKRQYHEFMEEYIKLGHMELVKDLDTSKPHYFLPHHGVINPGSTTTKLRVVFDASMKTSTNLSLNDILHTGPSIQDDLFAILLRFRIPRFVFTADVEKMYRQVWVSEEDRKYQLILWRTSPQEPIKCYQLCTVTYGITSAPYLAIKALRRAVEAATTATKATDVITKNMYVDDVMSGADTVRDALELQDRVRTILSSAGFHLRKWCSNHEAILKPLKLEDRAIQCKIQQNKDHHIKTLGMSWLPAADRFSIQHIEIQEAKRITKRIVLSEIAHLFDPLGIISPVVIKAKIMLQELWQLNLDWDAAVPMAFETQWRQFRTSLGELNSVTIPRHVQSANPEVKQIHVFSDASGKAYGAAVYIRVVQPDGEISVRLLCAKSKVAPVKVVTIPRLELCAAKLGSQLLQRVKKELQWESIAYFMWTDSEIVLAWLKATPNMYQTFVANRIAAIQEITPAHTWSHVSSKNNPADLVSRGISVDQLAKNHQWFYGPLFLYDTEETWPRKIISHESEVERKYQKIALPGIIGPTHLTSIIDHRNSFEYLQRVVAYVRRFIQNSHQSEPVKRKRSHLSVEELEAGLVIIVKELQQEGFNDDRESLLRAQSVKHSSPLKSLAPFLDDKGIIRVGGRLEAASINYDAKHPMLLPANHTITKLLLRKIHDTHRHAGPQATLAIMRQRFWPIKGKAMARRTVQQCITCAKAKPQWSTQLMGNLPATRIEPARPFVNSGVDFCGPMRIHYKSRGKHPQKCYVAIFCCFATKAVHIEVVSDLTTDAFIAALKRFMSRRGNCRKLYCDNATNFVGARNKIKEMQDMIHTEEAARKINGMCTARGTEFHFIPPRAPHFGGLWEAAVKSAKHLMQRSLANAPVTYEELETVMVEIEGILNSRPLTPMSSDPNDLSVLTPGHFLIGEPLTAMVDPHSEPRQGNAAQRWKMISVLKDGFWKRWTWEYLSELQNRCKWIKKCDNIEPGTMVLVKGENTPALKWQLGRIVNCTKGMDGLVRVVDVRTQTGVISRPIEKIAVLPIHNNQQESQDDANVMMDQEEEPILQQPRRKRNNTSKIKDDTEHPPVTDSA